MKYLLLIEIESNYILNLFGYLDLFGYIIMMGL